MASSKSTRAGRRTSSRPRTARQIVRAVAHKAAHDAFREAFGKVFQQAVANRMQSTRAVVGLFLAEWREALEWYEARS